MVKKILPAEDASVNVETVVTDSNDDATNDVFVERVSEKELKVPVLPLVEAAFRVLDVVLVFVVNSFEVDLDEDADEGVYIDEDVGKNVDIAVVV